jgi:O-antigen ligase
MMTELRGGSANFWLLLTVSLIACFSRSGGFPATIALFRPYRPLFLALLMFPITVILAMIWSQSWLGPDTERALRVFFGMLGILGALLGIKANWLRQSVWGVFAGVAGGAGSIILMTWPHFRRPDMDQYTTVGYSNILLILIVIVVFSLGWKLTRFYRAEQALKLTVALLGLCGLATTETRTIWVVMPFFLAIGLYLARSKFREFRLFKICTRIRIEL